MLFLGVDISKSSFDACLLLPGKKPAHRKFANNHSGFRSFSSWVDTRTPDALRAVPRLIAMEATGQLFYAFAAFCVEQGWRCFVLNPFQVKRFSDFTMNRHKTDRGDALLIARFLKSHHEDLRTFTPPHEDLLLLRALNRRIQSMKDMRTQELNRKKNPEVPGVLHQSIQRTIDHINAELEALWDEVHKVFTSNTTLKRQFDLLKTVPRCGDVLALTVLTELGDVQRFNKAKEVTAWSGMVPRQRESGSSVRGRPTLCKMGNKRVRKVLYMASVGAVNHPQWAQWVQARKTGQRTGRPKTGKKLIVSIMDKLLRILYGVLKNGRPFDPNRAFPA